MPDSLWPRAQEIGLFVFAAFRHRRESANKRSKMVTETMEATETTQAPGEGEAQAPLEGAETSAQPEAKVEVNPEVEALKARQAELAAQYAEIEKERNDLRSQQIGKLKEADRQRRLEERLDALADAIETGDSKAYKAKIAEQEQSVVVEESLRQEERETIEDLNDIAKGLGMTLEDTDQLPAFENARVNWRNWMRTADRSSLRQSLREARRAETVIKAEQSKKQIDEQAKAVKEAEARGEVRGRQGALVEMGATSLGSGEEAGGSGSLSLDALAAKDTRKMNSKQLKEHDMALDAAMRRGK